MDAIRRSAGMTRRGFLAASSGVLLAGRAAYAQTVPVVAAAASLRFALEEVAAEFERSTEQRVRLSFGATGTIVAQIQNGAPYEVFFAADDVSTLKLHESGLTKGSPRVFARGALALAVPKGLEISIDPQLNGLEQAVSRGRVKRFAIANPKVAPYGAAAKAVLMKANLWDALADKIIIGENVGQAAQFVATGAVEAGLVALSLTRTTELSQRLLWVAVEEELYAPIEHTMAVMKTASPVGEAFAEHCLGPAAGEIFKRHGFLPPA